MELAALYDYKLAENTALSFYAAPVGDPAFGPPAFPHRASASEDPIAPLGHHFQDSTHIANEVITLGIAHTISGWKPQASMGANPMSIAGTLIPARLTPGQLA